MNKLQLHNEFKQYKASSILIRVLTVISICIVISACSQRIASSIEKAENFSFVDRITTERIEELGFKRTEYCLPDNKKCISYYYGSPLVDNNLNYSATLGRGDRENIVKINLNRDSLDRSYHGTVVLLHGFRTSKEFMLNSALYFRFLGFQVIVPDLLGHGDTGGKKKYGVDDSKYINSLIDNLVEEGVIKDENIYIVGSSLGALTATHISSLRSDINGIILLAPMPQFDEAVYNYMKIDYPVLSRIIPERDIRKGAVIALKRANIDLKDTNIQPLLKTSQTPTLLILSNSDQVSPYANYKQLKKNNIKIFKVNGRYHPSMNTIGDVEHEAIIKWLNTTQ
ncbi:alpha/beta hydrolase [Microbulbifer sp. THAF38]|uniref:alpha/beta hydrolase n=1 Tax=Microbulbifer sp. THAF38 TaxID=2587856 RepID=UPI001267F91E|nr:alpha/beta hydrolase [Microbulbifer sp. THAF38]QFT54844.1 esterase [Microbulbifer sp. THAF38]